MSAVQSIMRALSLALVLVLAVTTARADVVGVRSQVGGDFVRLIFDWPRPVAYQRSIDDRYLVLTFEREIDARFGTALNTVAQYVEAPRISNDGRSLIFPLRQEVDVKTLAQGASIFIDFFPLEPLAEEALPPPVVEVPTTPPPPPPLPAYVVRGGVHPDYDRLVFDLDSPPSYTVARDGGTAAVVLNRRGTVDLARANLPSLTNVAAVTERETDPLRVELSVPADARIHHFATGNRVVIDIYDPPPGTPAAVAPPSPEPEPEPEPEASATDVTDVPGILINGQVPTPPPSASAAPADPAPEVESAAAAPAPAANNDMATRPAPAQPAVPTEPATLPPATGTPAAAVPAYPANPVTPPTSAAAPPPPASLASAAATTLLSAAASQTAPAQPAPTTGLAQPVPAQPIPDQTTDPQSTVDLSSPTAAVPPPAGEITVDAASSDNLARLDQLQTLALQNPGQSTATSNVTLLDIDPGIPAGLAVFARYNHLWLVLDRVPARSIEQILARSIGEFSRIESLVTGQGVIIRLPLPMGMEPSVDRDGNRWLVSFARNAPVPLYPLQPDPDPGDPLGARILIEAENASRVITIDDPDTLEILTVVPLPVAGRGLPEQHLFPDVELFQTAQGIAVRPINDQLETRAVPAGVILTVSGGTGLALSAISDTEPVRQEDRRRRATVEQGRIFDLPTWRGPPPFLAELQRLNRALAASNRNERNRARTDLARFYFSHGLMAEALGLLELVEAKVPSIKGREAYRALKGATLLYSGQVEEGMALLNDARLDGYNEVSLWRGYGNSLLGNYDQASIDLSVSMTTWGAYPPPFRQEMGFIAAETFARTNKLNSAQDVITRMIEDMDPVMAEADSELNFTRGLVLSIVGEREPAKEALRVAMQTRDRLIRMRAATLLTDLEVEDDDITPAQAAERLESLRYAWRGDQRELELLDRLGRSHVDADNYRDGFNAWRSAISYFPDSPEAERIARDMRNAFVGAFLDPERSQRLTPLEALTMFDEFRELTPTDQLGDDVISALSIRLVQIDLLDQAGNLLEHQARFRLGGGDQLRAATRLAGIRLEDNDPLRAIDALDIGNDASLGPGLRSERRILRARAMEMLGRSSDALALLEPDTSRQADALRAAIAWRSEDYPAVAGALLRVVPPPPSTGTPIDPNVSPVLLRIATAMVLADDQEGLTRLRELYGLAMNSGPHAAQFRSLTSEDAFSSSSSINLVRQSLNSTIDVFREAMEAFTGAGGGQNANAAPATASTG